MQIVIAELASMLAHTGLQMDTTASCLAGAADVA
jgi:hypothetical protein